MYTPGANSYVYQGSQDWGIHDFKYGIYPHIGDWIYAKTPWQGSFLNAPLMGFETSKHEGALGREISLLKINTHQVDVMAFKKGEESDYYIVRFSELYGKETKGVSVTFPGKVIDAYEVNGQEKKIGTADFTNGRLNFDMTHFAIRSFAVKFEKPGVAFEKPHQQAVAIPYNEDVISPDNNRSDGHMTDSLSYPAELVPSEVTSEDIVFKTGSSAEGVKNAVSARGQKINLPSGDFNKLYLLAAATEDTRGDFKTGNRRVNIRIQEWTGWIGQHYGRKLYMNDRKVSEITDAWSKTDNMAWYATHRHSHGGNDAYQYSYLFKYEIDLPKGAKSITLPDNDKIKIFAITAAQKINEDVIPLQPLYDDFRDNTPVYLRVKEYVTADLNPMKYVQQPLFTNDRIESRDQRANARLKSYLKSLGLDTVIVKTLPSTTDYADVQSGNGVTAVYYATGKSTTGKDFKHAKLDMSHVINSQSGSLADTVWFDNGEGRFVIDLQKSLPVHKINLYQNSFRGRGNQVFSMWTSVNPAEITGDPKAGGGKYVGMYGTGRGGMGAGGTSLQFEEDQPIRYLMFISDGTWHGNDFLGQLDIFTRSSANPGIPQK